MSKKIHNGLYLIIDPSMPLALLLPKLEEVASEGLAAIQIWDNFGLEDDPISVIAEIRNSVGVSKPPIIMNNRWKLVKQTAIDGVHFDHIPENIAQIKKELGPNAIIGITCNNDLSVVDWANRHELDYLSFCSMFPSSTANSCELVAFDTVKEAVAMTRIPIFLAGGIRPDNMESLATLDYSGIAVVSGVMNAQKPAEALKQYKKHLKNKSI